MSELKISKAEVMKRAWRIYKGKVRQYLWYNFNDFKHCLMRAWEVSKENLKSRIEEIENAEYKARIKAHKATNPEQYVSDPIYIQQFYDSLKYKGD